MYAPVASRPPSPELSEEEQKSSKRSDTLRVLFRYSHQVRSTPGNDSREPTFVRSKRSVLVDLVYTRNYDRVYAEHKIRMGRYNWRARIAEIEGTTVLPYSNKPAARSNRQLKDWNDPFDTAKRGHPGPHSGSLKRVNCPLWQVEEAAKKLKYARQDLQDVIDDHHQECISSGKGRKMNLYQPNHSYNPTTAYPKRAWHEYADVKSMVARVVRPSRLRFESKFDGTSIEHLVHGSTSLEILASQQQKLVDSFYSAFDILFEKFWTSQVDARAAVEELRGSHAVPIVPIALPPSPPTSPPSSPTKSTSPTKTKTKSSTKSKRVKSEVVVEKTRMTVSEILDSRVKEQRQRAGQGQGIESNGHGQQQFVVSGHQAQRKVDKYSSFEVGSGTGSGTGFAGHQKRQRSPQKAERGRTRVVPQWQEDCMKTVRREISP